MLYGDSFYDSCPATTGFIHAVRLQKAKDLLQNTDLNVNEVAYEVGYKDPSYFSRKFTETYGMNPSRLIEYRIDSG